jgi:octaprenyl-diphosphate synthase
MKRLLSEELPRIDAFLAEESARLDDLVRPVAEHVLAAGGKRFRPLLALLTARAAGLDPAVNPYPLACSLEFLHTATLLHDDILDGAVLRRGQASTHTVFTKTETILAGDVMLALANQLVAEYGVPRLVACLSRAIMLTAQGEIAEIAASRQTDLHVDDYLAIITGKTAYLIEASTQAGAILAGADENLEQSAAELGLNLGIAFQLVDDALDYVAPSDISGKPAGGDLREGKLTLPLIAYLDGLDKDRRTELLADIKNRALDEQRITAIVEAVVDGGHAERARQRARDYVDKARKALAAFPESTSKELLDACCDFVLSRSK